MSLNACLGLAHPSPASKFSGKSRQTALQAVVFGLMLSGCGGSSKKAQEPSSVETTPLEVANSAPASASVESEPAALPSTSDGTETNAALPPANSGAAAVSSSAEPPKRPGLTVAETRTTEVIRQVVAQNRPSVRVCYERALANDPKLRGTVTVHFTIDPEGKVSLAEINAERTSIALPVVQQCVLAALRKITFPESSRGFESTVNYPFDFRPAY